MRTAALVLGALTALVLLDRLALWAEARGWIYYRRHKPSSSALGSAFLEVQSMMEPGAKALVERQREEHTEVDESGEPPDPEAPMPADLVLVAELHQRHDAELARGALAARGILAWVESDDCGATDPALGFVRASRLLVAHEDAEAAAALLASVIRPGDRPPEG